MIAPRGTAMQVDVGNIEEMYCSDFLLAGVGANANYIVILRKIN